MGRMLIKVDPDQDLYIEWSSVVEAPTGFGTRAQWAESMHSEGMAAWQIEDRLQRADETGSSGHPPFSCNWNDHGEIYMQRGWLPRSAFAELARRYMALSDDRQLPDVDDLLKPFDEDAPV